MNHEIVLGTVRTPASEVAPGDCFRNDHGDVFMRVDDHAYLGGYSGYVCGVSLKGGVATLFDEKEMVTALDASVTINRIIT